MQIDDLSFTVDAEEQAQVSPSWKCPDSAVTGRQQTPLLHGAFDVLVGMQQLLCHAAPFQCGARMQVISTHLLNMCTSVRFRLHSFRRSHVQNLNANLQGMALLCMSRPLEDCVIETQSDWGYSLGVGEWKGATGHILGREIDPLCSDLSSSSK